MAKVHWHKAEGSSMCGRAHVQFTGNGQDVTCEHCKKLLPEVRRTAWDLLNDEEPPPAPEKPKRVRKSRPTKVVDRTNSMTEGFKIAYGVEPVLNQKPPPAPSREGGGLLDVQVQYRVRIPWQAWAFVLVALGLLLIAAWGEGLLPWLK